MVEYIRVLEKYFVKKYQYHVNVPWRVFKPLLNLDGTVGDINPLYWCSEQFGPANAKSRWKYKMNSDDELEMDFWFTNDKDASYFILKWL
jgi:hypothetical protein